MFVNSTKQIHFLIHFWNVPQNLPYWRPQHLNVHYLLYIYESGMTWFKMQEYGNFGLPKMPSFPSCIKLQFTDNAEVFGFLYIYDISLGARTSREKYIFFCWRNYKIK